MNVDKVIKDVCKEKGISIEKLADKIGMAFSTLYYAMEKNSLKVSTLIKISKALEIPIWSFFKESDGGIKVMASFENKSKIMEFESEIEKLKNEIAEKKDIIEDKKKYINALERLQQIDKNYYATKNKKDFTDFETWYNETWAGKVPAPAREIIELFEAYEAWKIDQAIK
jgi:transcriptional regulator with XRE-family HTH domain